MTPKTFPVVLFYTSGLPGAGKTTLAENLTISTNAKAVMLDKIAFELFRFPNFSSSAERDAVLREANFRVEDFITSGSPVIYDASVNTTLWRDHLKTLATKLKVKAVPIYIKTPTELCRERSTQMRKSSEGNKLRVVTSQQFNDKLEEFINPQDEINLIEVLGTEPFAKQLEKIIKTVPKI